MIVTLEDDGYLHLYESTADIVRDVEGLDAEETLRAVFDLDGQRYRIEWIRPNVRGWLLVESGEYRLVAEGAPSTAELKQLVERHPAIDPQVEATLRTLLL